MRPQRSSITEFPGRSSDHGINSAQADQSGFSLRLNAFGSDMFAWHGRCPAEAIGAISRSLAGGYTGDQGRPRSQQSLCLQSGHRTSIVAQSGRISLVLHTGRKALDKLAGTTQSKQGSRPRQTFRRYRTVGQLLKVIRRLPSRPRLHGAQQSGFDNPCMTTGENRLK